MQYRASTTIAAPAQAVWDVLVDVDRWHEWDPHVERVDGQAFPGGRIKVSHQPLLDDHPGRRGRVRTATPDGLAWWHAARAHDRHSDILSQ